MIRNDTEREGYHAFFKGQELDGNPYPANSAWAKSWEKGNWEAYDEYRQRAVKIGEDK